MYRVGFPGWKIAARFGVPIRVLVQVSQDKEAGVYIATSGDIDGLVLEADSLDSLREEVRGGLLSLLELELGSKPRRATSEMRFEDTSLCAA